MRLVALFLVVSAVAAGQTLIGDYRSPLLNARVEPLGDLNGDGVADLGIEFYTGINVYSGTDFSLIRMLFVSQQANALNFAPVGDVDGDGVVDVVVGSSGFPLAPGGSLSVISGLTGLPLWQRTGTTWAPLGFSVAGIGDLDGDGWPDVAANTRVYAGTAPMFTDLVAYSGNSGAIIASVIFPHAYGAYVLRGGRFDADAVPDFLIVTPGEPVGGGAFGRVRVVAGATGAVIRTFSSTVPAEGFADSVSSGRDTDLDGFDEILIGAPAANAGLGLIRVYSGQTGALLLAVSGSAGGVFAGRGASLVGDVDGDAIADFVTLVAVPIGTITAFKDVVAYSGQTGAIITRIAAFPNAAAPVAGYAMPVFRVLGDVTGDGRPELVLSKNALNLPSGTGSELRLNFWSVATIAWPPVATVNPIIGSCLSATLILMGRPVLGSNVPMEISGLPGVSSCATLYLSNIPAGTPYSFNGCPVLLDVPSINLLAQVPCFSWSLSATVSIPPAIYLAGVPLRLQAVVSSPAGGGAALSNAVEFTIGN